MISIIVPVYNAVHSLQRCVKTICAQTINEWELLLIDDGSTDGSSQLCDQLAMTDPRIHTFHKVNGGVSSARNIGLQYAKGKYIMFCDSDDWVENDWCEKLYLAAAENPDCLPICNYYRNSKNGEIINKVKECSELSKYIEKMDFFCLNRYELLGIPWNKIFRRSILKEHNIRFCEELSLGEDLIFNLDYLHYQSGGIVFINSPLNHYFLGNIESLSTKYYTNLSEIYQALYRRIKDEMECIPDAYEKWEKEYYCSYFFAFDRIFRNTWLRKHNSLVDNWCHNCKVFHGKEFQSCRNKISKENINLLQYYGLQTNSFSVYWLFVKFTELGSYYKKLVKRIIMKRNL